MGRVQSGGGGGYFCVQSHIWSVRDGLYWIGHYVCILSSFLCFRYPSGLWYDGVYA
jgi:hypothetical protein